MSWLDKIPDNIIIRTGDRREYQPQWLNAKKSVEYNVTEFNFPGLAGTLVKRQLPRGARYSLELFFQGEDHLDLREAFETSAADPRDWTIIHPFYGSMVVQPLGFEFDNSGYNVSKVTGTVVETITEDAPKTEEYPPDKIVADKSNLDAVFAESFAADVQPDTNDINNMSANNQNLYKLGSKRILTTVDSQEYFDLFNKAEAAVINATADPLAAISALQTAITYPSKFADSVTNRLTTLFDQFSLLRTSLATIISPSSKKIYENNAAAIISSMSQAAATPQDGDYENRDDVYNTIELVLSAYNTYLADLDTLQTDNGGNTESFIPDSSSIMGLSQLVNYTLSNLFNIAIDSKQERAIFVEDDTNVILLAHRFYGLDATDSTIDTIVQNNNIGLNEVLHIRKGRRIIYYV